MSDQTDEQLEQAAAKRKAIADALRVELHYAQHKGFERPDVDVAGIRKALADLGEDVGEDLDDTADHAPRRRAVTKRQR